jgi:hypothetical protein
MLADIYRVDDRLTEDDYYDALIFMLGDIYPDMSEDELEATLEKLINHLPEDYSETSMNTVGNVAKNIGTGTLKFLADNPEITQIAGAAIGGYIGGPTGAKAGTELAKVGNEQLKKNYSPATGKTLSLMQNPQAQTALTRASLGVGNGAAPLAQNGSVSLVPVATYLRALIVSAQEALRELDSKNIVPAAAVSESIPYSEDIDKQAKWLAEALY